MTTIQDMIQKGAEILTKGGIVVYPTDTVYGLGACFDNIPSVTQIYEIKNRPFSTALPILLADTSWIGRYAIAVSSYAEQLIEAFFPGALTLILTKAASIPSIVTGGRDTIALRVPAHPVTLALIEQTGKAVTGTSANLSGLPSAHSADDAQAQLGDRVDFIIDGGRCPGGTESTIVDATGEVPVIVRKGAISFEEIASVCHVINNNEE